MSSLSSNKQRPLVFAGILFASLTWASFAVADEGIVTHDEITEIAYNYNFTPFIDWIENAAADKEIPGAVR